MLLDPESKAWAVVRVFLGTAQIIAAMTTVILYFQVGQNWLTETGLGVTLLLLLLSRLLYGGSRRKRSVSEETREE